MQLDTDIKLDFVRGENPVSDSLSFQGGERWEEAKQFNKDFV